jgi:hypothetical protein
MEPNWVEGRPKRYEGQVRLGVDASASPWAVGIGRRGLNVSQGIMQGGRE